MFSFSYDLFRITIFICSSIDQAFCESVYLVFVTTGIFNSISRESKPSWDQEIRDDVIEECSKHGGVLHLYVDKASPQGNVYVKCPTISAAVASVNSLHGRFFGGM